MTSMSSMDACQGSNKFPAAFPEAEAPAHRPGLRLSGNFPHWLPGCILPWSPDGVHGILANNAPWGLACPNSPANVA